MRQGEASRTAERVAVERAAHRLIDSPLVLDDPVSIQVIDPEAAARLRAHPERHDRRSPITKFTRAMVVVRTRVAEDELARAAARGVTQYVLLGAGFDTFAYRNPLPGIRVFEVDHPATQQVKRARLAAAGIAVPGSVTFIACDFVGDTLPQVLAAGGFDAARPAVIAWLGVVMYLTRHDVLRTLRYIASLPYGTALIFDYAVPPSALPWLPRLYYRKVLQKLDAEGEPWLSFFEPAALRADLEGLGFAGLDDLGAADIDARYLSGRTDGLKAGSVGRIAIARR